MSKYQKKPVIVDAWKWDESRTTFNKTCHLWMLMSCSSHEKKPDLMCDLRIMTDGGTVSVAKGDYIVRDSNGAFLVYDPVYFERFYNLLEED
jgi:hypothetical protein